MTTRRAFVGHTSRAVAGFTLAGHMPGMMQLSPALLRTNTTAGTLLEAMRKPIDLDALVTTALDAAKGAGASFADIRLSEFARLRISHNMNFLTSNVSYGIRVIADGAWAFIHGTLPETDHIAAAARDAVATARGLATIGAAKFDLVSMPAAQGTWSTPIHGDPFVIPIRDQRDLLHGFEDIQRRALGQEWLDNINVLFDWRKDFRLYGSTEGSRVSQTLFRSRPDLYPEGSRTFFPGVDALLPKSGATAAAGYEAMLNPAIPEQLKANAELALEYSRLPGRHFDAGRYPVAVDGMSLGAMFGQSVGLALELDRALGYENDATGSSFLGHPEQVLGKQMINPLLQVQASRAVPHFQAVKWDDDGVVPEPYTLLKDGVVVDYHASRQTASALASWYQSQGKPVHSNGCAVADTATDQVTVQMPHVTIAPVAGGGHSVDDMCHGMTHGLLLRKPNWFWLSMDQQLSGGALGYVQMYEIVNGKVVGRAKDVGIQFRTLDLWKNLKALGSEQSVGDCTFSTSKGMPWAEEFSTATAPAGLFTQLNVVNTGLRG